jgi:hypothetical protein
MADDERDLRAGEGADKIAKFIVGNGELIL